MSVKVTVPPVPGGLHPAACWRKHLTGLDESQRGGYCVRGDWLDAGAVVELPAGALLVAVDKTTTGWTEAYRTGERIPVEDADVAVLLVDADADGGVRELWRRRFKSASNAFGAASRKKIAALLAAHPANGATATVVTPARRANTKPGTCRWCGADVAAGAGQLVGRGADAKVEHRDNCPPQPLTGDTACERCGVVALPEQARRFTVREGEGRSEVRHWDRYRPGRDCTVDPYASADEQREQARQQAAAEREQRRQADEAAAKRRAKAAERKAAKAAAEKEAHDAEQERVAARTVTGASARNLNDKGLGGSWRARLDEVTLTLDDGTTTLRWRVQTYRGDRPAPLRGHCWDHGADTREEYTRLPAAQTAYRGFTWDPQRDTAPQDSPAASGPQQCTVTAPHCDECGATESPAGWMIASLGRACDTDCLDAMSDRRGRHQARYHR